MIAVLAGVIVPIQVFYFAVPVFAEDSGSTFSTPSPGTGSSASTPIPGSGSTYTTPVPGNQGGISTLQNPLKVNSIGGFIESAVEIFSYIAVLIAVLMFIWVGLQYVLARGNSEKIKELSAKLLYIVIGVAIVIGARLAIQIVISTLQATGTVNQQVIESANRAARGN